MTSRKVLRQYRQGLQNLKREKKKNVAVNPMDGFDGKVFRTGAALDEIAGTSRLQVLAMEFSSP